MKKNISFYIVKKRVDNKGLAPIYGQITIKSKNYPFLIEKIQPRYWPKSKAKQRVYENKENEPDNRHVEINDLLDRISANTERFNRFDNYKISPPREEVKKVFFQLAAKHVNFNNAYDEFIESCQGRVKNNTVRNRKTAKNFIIDRYQKHIGVEIQFSDINLDFFENLYDYAMDIAEIENNTFSSYISKFKSFLEWANTKKYYTGTDYKEYSFSEKEKNVICLEVAEFEVLFNHDFKNDRLNKAKDLYCFSCVTGLRFADISTLKHEHFQGEYIVKNISKTKENDRIPILPEAQIILDRYKGNLLYPLPKLSNVKLNKYIKECCKLVEINETAIKFRYRGAEVIQEPHPKYELITVHTARKTFISLCIHKGMEPFYIKRITGHKKEATFERYVKLSDNKVKDHLFNAWEKTSSIKLSFNAIIEKKSDELYSGFVQELPKIKARGKSIDELIENIKITLNLFFENQRQQTAIKYNDNKFIHRKISITG